MSNSVIFCINEKFFGQVVNGPIGINRRINSILHCSFCSTSERQYQRRCCGSNVKLRNDGNDSSSI